MGVATMGKVLVPAKIENLSDVYDAEHGRLSADKVRSVDVPDALVDTGAVRCVIPPHVVEKIGATIRGQRVAEYADGRQDTVGVTGPILFDIQGRDTLEEALVLGDEVLIGQTVLEKLDLMADCANRRLVPNPAHPDQPVTKVK